MGQQNLVTLRGECAKLRQEGACLQGSLEEATAEASERQREITQFRALLSRMDAGWNEMSKQLEAAMLTRHELHSREERYEAARAEDLKAQRNKLEFSLQETAEAEHAQRETAEQLA